MGWGIVKMKDSALNQLLGSTAWKSISIVHESSKYIYIYIYIYIYMYV